MTPEQFKREYECNFTQGERDIKLYKRVERYFMDTDLVDFNTSIMEAKSLTAWCQDNGYKRSELVEAKRCVEQYKSK